MLQVQMYLIEVWGFARFLRRDHPSSVSGKSTTGTIRPPQHNHDEKRGIWAFFGPVFRVFQGVSKKIGRFLGVRV